MATTSRTIKQADFNPRVCSYWTLLWVFGVGITGVGILLLPFIIPLAFKLTRLYLSHMSCTLTQHSLVVKKGILVKTEKTIPLEKITDLGLLQGPIMRLFDIHAMSIETAGSTGSSSPYAFGSPLISIAGIIDVKEFRQQILDQIELAADNSGSTATTQNIDAGLLTDIRDTLHRIEHQLNRDN
ncbi:MAG: PH domain-containing protein [Gammaproteobacteria bacterium]|nr:PH domain-containing protein [Gammaproteobacteria bacterium]